MKARIFRCLFALLLCVAVSPWAFAQTTTATLQGNVSDPSGASVPEAKVTISNTETGISQELNTDADGRFVQPFLLPGAYQVVVEKSGFQRYLQSGVRLNVQQTQTLDIALKIGDVSATVEVSDAAAAALATSTSSVATVIENKRIVDLPLNGRNPFALVNLTPGVVPGPGSTPWISGGRNASSEITIDGTSIILPENNVSINTLAYTPSVDAVEEFSVVTNSLAAEYGRTGGGVINVATKQGTNTLHGTLFEFLRNNKLDANDFFANRAGRRLGAFQRNQFGGTVGGPIRIPKIYNGTNRTFFFFSEQSTRQRSASVTTTTVPLPEWIRGDFSNLRNSAGQLIRIYDPLTTDSDGAGGFTRTQISCNGVLNVICPERIDPVARRVAAFFPLPNTTPVNAFTQVNNFFVQGKAVSDDDRIDARVDHQISDDWRVFGRVSYSRSLGTPVNFFGNAGTPGGDGPSRTDSYNVALNSLYTINSTTVFNLSYGFGRFNNVRQAFSSRIDLTTLGFPAAVQAAASTQNLEFPRFNIAGVTSLGQNTFTTLRFVPNTHIVRGDVTKVFSNHTVKFGGEFRKMLLNFLQLGQPSGEYNFNQAFTQRNPVQPSSTEGFGLASFLLGTASGGSISNDPAAASASEYIGFYVQDDWRVSQNLTLNLGLRYDVDVPRTERYDRYSYFDINAPSPIQDEILAKYPNGRYTVAGREIDLSNLRGAMRFVTPDDRHQTPTDRDNISPRVGFAYRLGEKTVARGAYALMYSGSMMQAAGASGSAGMEGYRGGTPFISSLDGGRRPATFLSNPFPNGFNLPLGSAERPNGGAETNLGLGVGESFFIDYVNPVIQQWNVNVQRELPGNFVIEVGYLGSKGNHLIDGEGSMTYNQLPTEFFALRDRLNDTVENPFLGIITNPNSSLSQPRVTLGQLLRPFPQYTSVNGFRKPQANSIYHSFILRAEKRYSNGLGLLLSYTGSKLIDDASQTVTFLGQAGNKQNFYNRRAERSISAQDISSRLVISSNYELPIGRGRAFLRDAHPVVDAVLGGWQLNGILVLQTGTPVVITQNQNNTGLGSSGQRPNNNGQSASLTGGTTDERLQRWFDTSVFTIAPAFTFGNVPRTLPDVRNPGQRNVDLSVFKNFPFRENRFALQLRAEAFNAFNTPQFAAPNAQLGNSSFGIISGLAVAPRQVQLALKFIY